MKKVPVIVKTEYWFKIMTHYQNLLMEKYLYMPFTPAIQHQMKSYLNDQINICKSRETHPAWHVPIELKFDINRQSVDIVPTDPESIDLI